MTTKLGPGLTYTAGLVSEQRSIRRVSGSYSLWVAHTAASVEQMLLATQLEWLEELLDGCGDGIEAGLIDELGRPWVLTRGSTRMGSRVVWCAVLASHGEEHQCPIGCAGADWLRDMLGEAPGIELLELGPIPF